MSAPDQVLLSITPAHPWRGYLRSLHPRVMALILLGAIAIAVAVLIFGSEYRAEIIAPLILVVVIVGFAVLFTFLAMRKSRLEVTSESLKLYKGRRPPLVMPRENLGVAREVQHFKHGLGASGSALLLFDTKGLALLTMSGESWSASDRAALLVALGDPDLEVITDPMDRMEFIKRYPDAVTPATQKTMANQQYLNYVLLIAAAGVIIWTLVNTD